MKKVLNIGFQSNIINEEIAYSCLNYINDNIYETLFEFVNNNINVFNNKENVFKYFHKSFDTPSTIKYLVDNVNKFNPNLDLSDLIINYCHNNHNYNYYNYGCIYILRIYRILINFESLKNLKLKFNGIENIIRKFLDEKIIESLVDCDSINYNKILIMIKTIELLFNEKYLNENSNIYPNEKLCINKPHQPHSVLQKKYYKKILVLKFLIKFFETKNIKPTDKVLHILEIDIPDNFNLDIKSMLPKKIKPLK
jgi:hypothetical protein